MVEAYCRLNVTNGLNAIVSDSRRIRGTLLPSGRGPTVGRLMDEVIGQVRFWEESAVGRRLLQLSLGAQAQAAATAVAPAGSNSSSAGPWHLGEANVVGLVVTR
ncbi:hypothetical protein CKAH01_05453 [Colletotrichum kahawae]|uniref:Uncharacterized protein n=1 Tax=Colletotrichum kahawae TaxID=34407 RepID=A0AAD9YFG5_COLKA|nr:hypothetical protein CKAH01_05453 [Colletotrichum kahawae]